MKPAAEILHYAEIYTTNLRYHNAMLRSKDPDRYYREHVTEINLFNAAEHVLKSTYNINPNNMNLHHMQDSFSLMEEKKKTLSSTYKTAEKEVTELRLQLSNLQKYLSDSNIAPEQSHEKEGPTIQTNEHDKDHKKKKTEL